MKTFLISSQALYTACLAGWLVVWVMSFMVFDAGIQFWNSLFFIAVSLFPIMVAGCSITAWILRVRRERAAVIVNLVPMLWIVGFGLMMLING